MLLNLSLSGVPFIGSDVGGYSGGATPELFARWMAVGSFSPFFRGHVTNGVNDQEPWAFGPEVEAISRSLIPTPSNACFFDFKPLNACTGEPCTGPRATQRAFGLRKRRPGKC